MLVCGSGHAMDAGAPVPQRLNQPVALDRPDQTLFNEAVLIYSNEVRRHEHGRGSAAADPGLWRAAVGPRPQHGAAPDPQPRAAGTWAARPVAADAPAVAAVPHWPAENIAMDKVYRLLGRPISMTHKGCSFVYGDTKEPVPVHTYASLARGGGSPLAGLAEAPRLAAQRRSYQRLGAGIGVDAAGPACGDFYLVQDFAD